jgi:hypothetical protein
MTPLQLEAELVRLQRSLRALEVGRVVLWALIAIALFLALGAIARLTIGAPTVTTVWSIAVMLGAITFALRWRTVQPNRVQRTDAALWAERQAPALQYVLVTLAEQPKADNNNPQQQALARFASSTLLFSASAAALRERRISLISRALLAFIAVAISAWPWPIRPVSAHSNAAAARSPQTGAAVPGRVTASATLLPPAYVSRAPSQLAFGETVSALAGSVLRIDVDGAIGNATLVLQEASDSGTSAAREVRVLPTATGWRGVIRVGTAPLALRLKDPVGERWLLLMPVVDSIPVATLSTPDADTVVLDTTARIRVAGVVHDDIALRDARVEYIISSGGGEQFTFRSGALAQRSGSLGRDLPVTVTLDIATLALKPGDVMHVRITAHDGNTLTGPSLGSSETRTIRIPRADERDSVAIDQLPPTPVDKSVLSQRQLLIYTERLVARMPRIDRPTMLAESQRIGADQARLRKQVSDIVFARLGDNPTGEHAHFPGDGHNHSAEELSAQATPEDVLKAADRATGGAGSLLDSHGDETPVVAVNRPLLEAYNAMWDATRALQGGVPRDALDPMRRALAAIQRARSAERIYLRGAPPAAIIDIAKIRMIGTDSANAEFRRAVNALPAPERRLAERLLRGMSQLAARNAGALDSLRLLRLDALATAPTLASAIGDAITAVEQRRDATSALLRARRMALAPWNRTGGVSLWSGDTP